MLTELFEKVVNGSWANSYRYTYTYDAHKNSLTAMYELFESGTWQPWIGDLKLFSNYFTLFIFPTHRYVASYIFFDSGIESFEGDNTILIYPNPATDQLSISISDYSNTTIEIFNILGQWCHTQILQSDKSEINIANLPSGLYLLKINNQTRTDLKKFIKK